MVIPLLVAAVTAMPARWGKGLGPADRIRFARIIRAVASLARDTPRHGRLGWWSARPESLFWGVAAIRYDNTNVERAIRQARSESFFCLPRLHQASTISEGLRSALPPYMCARPRRESPSVGRSLRCYRIGKVGTAFAGTRIPADLSIRTLGGGSRYFREKYCNSQKYTHQGIGIEMLELE